MASSASKISAASIKKSIQYVVGKSTSSSSVSSLCNSDMSVGSIGRVLNEEVQNMDHPDSPRFTYDETSPLNKSLQQVHMLLREGKSIEIIALRLGVSSRSVYRKIKTISELLEIPYKDLLRTRLAHSKKKGQVP